MESRGSCSGPSIKPVSWLNARWAVSGFGYVGRWVVYRRAFLSFLLNSLALQDDQLYHNTPLHIDRLIVSSSISTEIYSLPTLRLESSLPY